MATETFSGDKKDGVSLLHHAEVRLKATLIPCVPRGIETYHLTLTTIIWSILVVLFSWLATFNKQWMWGVSAAIIAQYITDLLDGAIGRNRDTGLIKWGYYMDHFLDYVFLCAMLIGYSLLIPNHLKVVMFFVMAVFCGFMVNSFLQFAATNKFRIAYWGIGPTEIRLVFIVINTLIIYINQAIYIKTLPLVLVMATFGLCFTAFNTQRQLWAIDMEAKAEKDGVLNDQEDLQGLVLRHFLLSFIIASLAFLVLITRIGMPYHKILAGIIYALSWLPALSALSHKAWIHVKTKPWVRKYMPLSIAAVILIVSAWFAMNLRPAPSEKAYSVSQIRASINEDANSVVSINQTLANLFAQVGLENETAPNVSELKQITQVFMDQQQDLNRLITSYEGYHTIDRQEEASLHDQAFLVWFSALGIQQHYILELMSLGTSEQISNAIKASNIDNTIENNVFETILRSVILPNTFVKIGYSVGYLRLISDEAEMPDSHSNMKQQLSQIAKTNIDAYYEKLEANKSIILDALKTVTLD